MCDTTRLTQAEYVPRYVRFFAIDTVLAAAGSGNGELIADAISLIRDSDGAIRWKTLNLLSGARDEQLAAAVPHFHEDRIQALTAWLRGANAIDVSSRIQGGDHLDRLFAVAAAARVSDLDRSPLDVAAAAADEEIATFAKEQIDLLTLRHQGQ